MRDKGRVEERQWLILLIPYSERGAPPGGVKLLKHAVTVTAILLRAVLRFILSLYNMFTTTL